MRSDARRNRERILDAASHCFIREGPECGMATIAKEAGVGSATMFRHFPAKQDLAEAVLLRCLEESEDAVAAAMAAADPAEGLTALLTHFVQSLVRDKNLHRIAGQRLMDRQDIQDRRAAVFRKTATVLRRCQESGRVEPDVQVTDLLTLTEGIAAAGGEEGWTRPLALVLRGISTNR
ncbi:TetR/AcrR family transcriptional regulator [Amycolatopsis sp. H6(2020)]|nr:TetR/AcrR family transcriptional regulator [Amycolatopsis sp. H6(2020)]